MSFQCRGWETAARFGRFESQQGRSIPVDGSLKTGRSVFLNCEREKGGGTHRPRRA